MSRPSASRVRSACLPLALAAAAWCAAPRTASAKAPSQSPSVEDILTRARTAEAEARNRLVEAQKDPFKEAIESYRDKKLPLTEYHKLTDLLNDAKDPAVQDYRLPAADALVARFEKEDLNDPAVRAVRREVAQAIVDLMKAPSTDDRGLMAVEKVLYAWWRTKLVEVRFKHTDKLRERTSACTKMKKFLKSDKE